MSAARRLQLSRRFSAVVFCSIAATHLAAAQNAPSPNNAAPPMTSPNENAAAGLADWRGQMLDRITRSMNISVTIATISAIGNATCSPVMI